MRSDDEFVRIARSMLPYLAFEVDRAEVYVLESGSSELIRRIIANGLCQNILAKAQESFGYTIAIIPHSGGAI